MRQTPLHVDPVEMIPLPSIMVLLVGAAASILTIPAYAADISCWGSPDVMTMDRTCAPLTVALFQSLRLATKDDVQSVMGATGEEDESGELTFTSNYGNHGPGAGTVQFRFGSSNLVTTIDASVVGEGAMQDRRFLWDLNADGVGCSDFPNSQTRCNQH
jgi:hypothetical protein